MAEEKEKKIVENLKGYKLKRKYDGITECSIEGIDHLVSFDFKEALNQSNPRNIFLNGQLYIEHTCDLIIIFYFFPEGAGEKVSSLWNYLKSRECSFSNKIQFLNLLKKKVPKNNPKNISDKFVKGEIISSLVAVAEIRNTFQHNLEYSEVLKAIRKSDRKLYFMNKKLKDYFDVNMLVADFKEEAIKLNNALGELFSTKDASLNISG